MYRCITPVSSQLEISSKAPFGCEHELQLRLFGVMDKVRPCRSSLAFAQVSESISAQLTTRAVSYPAVWLLEGYMAFWLLVMRIRYRSPNSRFLDVSSTRMRREPLV
ncbi:hypothetical protein DPSP01_012286 [Paraphaeosphaeria sporulosa]